MATAEAPLLLCIHRNLGALMRCMNYLAGKGFRCLVSASHREAAAIRTRSHPEAVLLLGSGMKDRDVISYQEEHFRNPDAQPLFLILSRGQVERLNGSVQDGPSTVIAGNVSLRTLRCTIQSRLQPIQPQNSSPETKRV